MFRRQNAMLRRAGWRRANQQRLKARKARKYPPSTQLLPYPIDWYRDTRKNASRSNGKKPGTDSPFQGEQNHIVATVT